MKACVIGLGETGESIALLLLQDPAINSIEILDPNPNIIGKYLDLSHAGASLNKKIVLNPDQKDCNWDVIFFCAGSRNSPNADRLTKAKENKELISSIFSNYHLKDNILILVISNPIELMSAWINAYFEGKKIVFGTGTELDKQRLRSILAKKTNKEIGEIQIDAIGEHGTNLIPLYSSARIVNNEMNSYFSKEDLDQITNEVKNMASLIRQTQDATKFGVAQCALNIWKAYNNEDISSFTLSSPLPSDLKKKFEINRDIYVSFPVEISQNKIKTLQKLNLSHEELLLFQKTCKKIEDQYS